jgi:3,4-dihydroxy 2-butanone 4-phosphate synthase
MNPDGSMSRGQDILNYAAAHDIVILSIDELAQHISNLQAS